MIRHSRLPGVLALALGLALAMPVAPGFTAGSGGSSGSSSSSTASDFQAAKKKIAATDYNGAIPLLEKVIKAQPKNADAHNLLAYSLRNTGKLEKALTHYNKALAIDPEHVGANEYAGELALLMNDLAKAEGHLQVLEANCPTCEETAELKEQIAAYRAKQQSS